ncbi:adenylyl cyclase X E-like isoform X2 [Drosophila bipectinata]|uniref:adenylyl cyclase X E-like isoform X2 n=1 Tax=Drosophila bipectinata TaxID=42026 RepID=UPI0038B31B28
MHTSRNRSTLMFGLEKRCNLNYAREHMWDPFYLKQKVQELGLTKEFNLYQIRLWRSYLNIFFVVHILVTAIHCTLLLVCSEVKKMVYVDVCVYLGCAVLLLSILSVNFCEKFVARHNWVILFTSVLAAIILLSADKIPAAFHYNQFPELVVGSYFDVYVVLVIYMYLPIPSDWPAIVLGTVTSFVYTVYYLLFMTPRLESVNVFIDAAHYVCLNMVGIFYRITTNMMVQSSFLDRHQYVKEELWLRNARWQEKALVQSIMPPQISKSLQSEIRKRITMVQHGNRAAITSMQRFMAVQIHPEVSILYADVVNYTHLTTTLEVETLMNILHDLYGRFDKAAVVFRVQRIKFLGDCYYCVAGITEADPDHAKNCVDLGFAMISHIQEIRNIYNVDIDMRIGVHSGSILAGVLGEAKLQFDIWESTGLPGCIHISSHTLNHLDAKAYDIEPGPSWAAEHPLLMKNRVETYILRWNNTRFNESEILDGGTSVFSFVKIRPLMDTDSEIKDEALEALFQEELHEEFKKMPVFRWEYIRRQPEPESNDPNLTNLCLTYKDKDMEKLYKNQRDYMFKYSMLVACAIGCLLLVLEVNPDTSQCLVCTVVNTILIIMFVALTFIAWYKKMCWARNQMDPKDTSTYNRFSCFIFYLLNKIQSSLKIRIGLYLFVILSHGTIITLILLLCDQDSFNLSEIEHKIFHYEAPDDPCFHPWVFTDMMSILICMAFTFTNIPLAVKSIIAAILSSGYLILVNLHLQYVFHHSFSSSPSLPAQYAHTLQILVTVLTVYQKERMTTFSSKVNFKVRKDLEKKQSDAALTNQSITILLHNILPAHVINVYLNSLAKHELYYENYQMVSVMFAMLMNFQMDLKNLRILNDIISEFDILLLYYKQYYVVEKIKVVGCTYMAACGLDLNFAESVNIKTRMSNLNASSSRGKLLSLPVGDSGDDSEDDMDEVVFVLASFALDMMRTLSKCKQSHHQLNDNISVCSGSITIGLSSGEVMAGIVGASQPHYDIWGNAVNMASRMQTTGLPDNIQVTEESANILQDFGIQCNFRGLTFVKGRGNIPTYLVGIDENNCFQDAKHDRNPSHMLRSTNISLSSAYTKSHDRLTKYDSDM